MNLQFNKYADGLVPAIIQDVDTQKVLMLGFMNTEAFELTQQQKRVTFFSRSKKRLWTKGEESGHFLDVKHIALDCDEDTLLIQVKPLGAVCHTGADTCWNEVNRGSFLNELETIIAQRQTQPSEGSYIASLFKSGINKIAQKVGEEAVETIIEAKDSNADLFANEAADLLFHYLVLLRAKGIGLKDIEQVLRLRHGKVG